MLFERCPLELVEIISILGGKRGTSSGTMLECFTMTGENTSNSGRLWSCLSWLSGVVSFA